MASSIARVARAVDQRARKSGRVELAEIVRALATKPKLLLLDEPASGQSDTEREQFARLLRELAQDGLGVLLVEHDMDLVFRFARRITVLVQGEVLCEGTPQEIAADKRVHQVYLGEQND